jgi:hypothetical protein
MCMEAKVPATSIVPAMLVSARAAVTGDCVAEVPCTRILLCLELAQRFSHDDGRRELCRVKD